MVNVILSTEEVMSVLNKRKTQFREIVNPQPPQGASLIRGPEFYVPAIADTNGELYPGSSIWGVYSEDGWGIKCPYRPGDKLWVKETWCKNENPKSVNYGGYEYKADYEGAMCQQLISWQLPTNMPRAAARIWLEVINVHIEKLQEITYDDCLREGMWDHGTDVDTLAAFQELWQSLNAKCGFGWTFNPWVWVVDFKEV